MIGERKDGGLGIPKSGKAIPTEAPEWTPVPGKPHFWVNAKGQMKYTPPEPGPSWHFIPAP